MAGGSGEYEPRDSRNVTGTASTPDGRWTNTSGAPLNAQGQPESPEPEEDADEAEEGEDEEGDGVTFEPDAELESEIDKARRQNPGSLPDTLPPPD